MKLRVAIVTDSFYPKIDGVAVSTENFCRILGDKGHSFLIICPEYGAEYENKAGKHTRILRVKAFGLPSYPDVKVALPNRKKLLKEIRQFKAQLIHIQTPGILGQFAANLGKKHGIPVIGTYHTMMNEVGGYLSPYKFLKLDKLLARLKKNKSLVKALPDLEKKKEASLTSKIIYKITNRVYEKGKLIISPSVLVKKELRRVGVKKPIKVISNGLDLSLFKGKKKKLAKNSARLLHVGRIAYEKNPHEVLRAFHIVSKEIPYATLTVVGNGPAMEELRQFVEQAGLQEKVHFTGFVDRATLPQIYKDHDVFYTASTIETQGLVLLEAIASGLPAVGVDAYAIAELIHHKKNGYVAEPHDVAAMAKYLLKILSDRKKFTSFSAESLKIAGKHEIHLCADKLEKLYLKTAAR